jgi:predicted ferric reductase
MNPYPTNAYPPDQYHPPQQQRANQRPLHGYQPNAGLAHYAAPLAPPPPRHIPRSVTSAPRPANLTRSVGVDKPVFSLSTLLVIFGVVIFGVLIALLIVPGMFASLTSNEGEGYWYLSRASGFVAYILLWLSMMFGLIITDRFARLWPGGPVAYDLHQYFSLIGIAFTLFHIFILLGSKYINYTLMQLLVPFAGTDYRPLWIGLGQYSFYLSLVVTITFYARSWFGPRGWRVLHYLSFAFFGLALLHSAFSGTDTTTWWAGALYWTTGITTLFLTVYRIIRTLMKPSPQRRSAANRAASD